MTKPARAFILDPALVGPIGHHLNMHRGLAAEFARRGIAAVHMANHRCDDGLLQGLQFGRPFRQTPYVPLSIDPLSGSFENFLMQADVFEHDLAGLPPGEIGGDDLVIIPVVAPGMLYGYVRWWAGLDPAEQPRTVFILQMLAGVLSVDPLVLDSANRSYRHLPELYRFIGNQLSALDCSRLHFMTVSEPMAEHYGFLLKQPVRQHPFYRVFETEAVDPVAEAFEQSAAPPTAGYFGDQRLDKGFDLIPDVLEMMLARHPTAEFVIQINLAVADDATANETFRAITRRIADLAQRSPRVRLLSGFVSLQAFCEAIARTDILLQPYRPIPYALAPSGIFNDATAIGRPSVVPAQTWMARQIAALGGMGAVHDGYEPAAIADAALGLLERTAELRVRASETRRLWRAKHGTDILVDQLLEIARS